MQRSGRICEDKLWFWKLESVTVIFLRHLLTSFLPAAFTIEGLSVTVMERSGIELGLPVLSHSLGVVVLRTRNQNLFETTKNLEPQQYLLWRSIWSNLV